MKLIGMLSRGRYNNIIYYGVAFDPDVLITRFIVAQWCTYGVYRLEEW